jgi:hypothetical protein
MERYLDFWELGQIQENPEIGTFSPNLEFLKRDLLPLFWACIKIGQKPRIWSIFPKTPNLIGENAFPSLGLNKNWQKPTFLG